MPWGYQPRWTDVMGQHYDVQGATMDGSAVDEHNREVAEIVEAAVEFARNGTDPAPEDALKNVYA